MTRVAQGAAIMATVWAERLMGLMLKSLPSASAIVPEHIKKQAMARIRDHNPFATVPDRDELLRAGRWAWIEAALFVLEAAKTRVKIPEWSGSEAKLRRFGPVARSELVRLRDSTLDRRAHAKRSAIDNLLVLVIHGVAESSRDTSSSDTPLADAFVVVLAEVTAWPIDEVPALLGQIAKGGLLIQPDGPTSNFDELVFANFAVLLNDPTRYPEAREAFRTAMSQLALKANRAVLDAMSGMDARLADVIRRTDVLAATRVNLEQYLAQFQLRMESLPEDVAVKVVEKLMERRVGFGSGRDHIDSSTIIALARRLRPELEMDCEQAVNELEKAVDALCSTVAASAAEHESSDPIDKVIDRVVELNSARNFDAATNELAAALGAEIESELLEAEARRGKRRKLHQALLNQAIMRFDAVAAAAHIEAITQIDCKDQADLPELRRAAQANFLREGSDHGILLSLEIAVELARRMFDSACNEEERGRALLALAEAQSTLGARERGSERLLEAIDNYRRALALFPGQARRLLWAATQEGLGDALRKIGISEGTRALLDDAVGAYVAARRVFNRSQHPNEWAATQNGLGNAWAAVAELELADPTAARESLSKAVSAYRCALRVWTKDCHRVDWSMAKQNLGLALFSLAQMETGTRRLKQAAAALESSAEIRTLQAMPLKWAGTMSNLGNVRRLWGERTMSKSRLRSAIEAYDQALLVFTERHFPIWHAGIVGSRTRVLQLLDGDQSRAPLAPAVTP